MLYEQKKKRCPNQVYRWTYKLTVKCVKAGWWILWFDCFVGLIMGFSDYILQLIYFRNRSVSSDYCLVLCLYIFICIYMYAYIYIVIQTYIQCYIHILYNSKHFSSLSHWRKYEYVTVLQLKYRMQTVQYKVLAI